MKTGDATHLVFLDIETFSGEKPCLDEFTADGRLKDPVKIEGDLLKKQEAGWRKQSLDPFKGEVIVIGLAIDDQEPFCIAESTEKGTLIAFDAWLYDYMNCNVIGHNIIDFDGYWLFIKGLKYSLPHIVHKFCDKIWLKDTMIMMDGPSWKRMTSLDKMAKNFGQSGKGDIDGGMVHDMYLDGKIEQIKSYCQSDVGILRECYKALNASGIYT